MSTTPTCWSAAGGPGRAARTVPGAAAVAVAAAVPIALTAVPADMRRRGRRKDLPMGSGQIQTSNRNRPIQNRSRRSSTGRHGKLRVAGRARPGRDGIAAAHADGNACDRDRGCDTTDDEPTLPMIGPGRLRIRGGRNGGAAIYAVGYGVSGANGASDACGPCAAYGASDGSGVCGVYGVSAHTASGARAESRRWAARSTRWDRCRSGRSWVLFRSSSGCRGMRRQIQQTLAIHAFPEWQPGLVCEIAVGAGPGGAYALSGCHRKIIADDTGNSR